ncbi:MAG: leucine-rich repeat domain-containing protein [Candidatus Weimeria sp.]
MKNSFRKAITGMIAASMVFTAFVINPRTTAFADVQMLSDDPTTVKKIDDTHYEGSLGNGITYKMAVTGTAKITGGTVPKATLDVYGKGKVTQGNAMGSGSKSMYNTNFSKQFYSYHIEKLTFHDGITEIGDGKESSTGKFWNAYSIVLPNSVTKINAYAFSGCPITSIRWSKNLKTIGKEAFKNQCLKSISIPDSVTSIGDWAFETDSNNCKTVTVGKNCTKIGMGAFGTARDGNGHTYDKFTIKCTKAVSCSHMFSGNAGIWIKKFVIYSKPTQAIWNSEILDECAKIYVPKKNYKAWKTVALKAAKSSIHGEEAAKEDFLDTWQYHMKTF